MSNYPSCDFCGFCEHCPGHFECYHPCVLCGHPIAYDAPGCPDMFCASWEVPYLDEVNTENF